MSLAEFETRLAALREGSLPAAERAAVTAHLGTCAECRQALADADAGHLLFASARVPEVIDVTPHLLRQLGDGGPSLTGIGRWSPWVIIPGAALLMIGTLLWWIAWSGPPPRPTGSPPDPDAVGSASAELPPPAPTPPPVVAASGTASKRLPESEAMTWEFPDGSLVIAAAGSSITVATDGLRLDSGRIWCEISRRPGRRWVVQSANVTVTVLGTSFGMLAADRQVTVSLWRGRLAIDLPGQPTLELTAGEGCRVEPSGVCRYALSAAAAAEFDDLAKRAGSTGSVTSGHHHPEVIPTGSPGLPLTSSATPVEPVVDDPPLSPASTPATLRDRLRRPR